MGPRLRKLIGLFGLLAFMAAYVWAASLVAEHVPNHFGAQLIFYVVVGTFWFVPILPLITWMNHGVWRRSQIPRAPQA